MYQWQCKSCGLQMDGRLNYKPDMCFCGGTDFEDAELAEEREARNAAINAEDEFLEDI